MNLPKVESDQEIKISQSSDTISSKKSEESLPQVSASINMSTKKQKSQTPRQVSKKLSKLVSQSLKDQSFTRDPSELLKILLKHAPNKVSKQAAKCLFAELEREKQNSIEAKEEMKKIQCLLDKQRILVNEQFDQIAQLKEQKSRLQRMIQNIRRTNSPDRLRSTISSHMSPNLSPHRLHQSIQSSVLSDDELDFGQRQAPNPIIPYTSVDSRQHSKDLHQQRFVRQVSKKLSNLKLQDHKAESPKRVDRFAYRNISNLFNSSTNRASPIKDQMQMKKKADEIKKKTKVAKQGANEKVKVEKTTAGETRKLYMSTMSSSVLKPTKSSLLKSGQKYSRESSVSQSKQDNAGTMYNRLSATMGQKSMRRLSTVKKSTSLHGQVQAKQSSKVVTHIYYQT